MRLKSRAIHFFVLDIEIINEIFSSLHYYRHLYQINIELEKLLVEVITCLNISPGHKQGSNVKTKKLNL